MITLDTAQQAIIISNELDSRSIYLKATISTPLDKLNQLADIAPIVSTSLEYNPTVNEIVENSLSAQDAHGVEIEEYSEQICKAVQNHLNFAKSIVKPAIESVAEKLQKVYSELQNSKKFDLDIVVVDPVQPMIESSFQEMITAYKGLPYIGFSGKIPIPCNEQITAKQVIDLLKTNDHNIDYAIDQTLLTYGEGIFISTYLACTSAVQKDIQSLMNDPFEGDKVATIVFLLTNKLFNNPVDETNASLIDYNNIVDDLRKAAAFRLNVAYDYYETNNVAKFLIIRNTANKVFVNGPVYRTWVEQGGNNAALLGNAVSSNPKLLLDDIISNQSELLQSWDRQNVLINSAIQGNSFTTKKQAIKDAMLEYTTSNFETCFGHLVAEGVNPTIDMLEYTTYIKLLDEFINNLKETDLINIWSASTKVVCDCLFYYTDAKKILLGIDSAMLMNPDIELREALLLSTIEYVVDYACNQIEYN